jgi:hypothetical protein
MQEGEEEVVGGEKEERRVREMRAPLVGSLRVRERG